MPYIVAVLVLINILVMVIIIALSLCMSTKDNTGENDAEEKASVGVNSARWMSHHVSYRYRFRKFEDSWDREYFLMLDEQYDEFIDW